MHVLISNSAKDSLRDLTVRSSAETPQLLNIEQPWNINLCSPAEIKACQ